MFFSFIIDNKKITDWNLTNNSTKTSNIIQENIEQPVTLPSGPIDLNQLLKSRNDTYLKHFINPKCFPILMITPGFDDGAMVEQEVNAPFNIITLPVTINETEANDVSNFFSQVVYFLLQSGANVFVIVALE